eukprot:gnl/MRDRNA2_/MRDRNA2_17682_c0_seq1.p1 gnl/MRDRNA2_/MRDRNA2_17682_c0~~gnl/MRDRNA2_/MRDRNA2_17682_c0_seq1.p1  ORF type:complete len:357 (+),score=68.27 gnl/MRDRNA2_/MRDRNA2_17682_c0_seq1:32-1072(+)
MTQCTTQNKQSNTDNEAGEVVSLAKELGINGPQNEKLRLLLHPLISTCQSMVKQEAAGESSGPGDFQFKIPPNLASWVSGNHSSSLTHEKSQCKMKGSGIHYHGSDYWYGESHHYDFEDSPCHWRCCADQAILDLDDTTARESESDDLDHMVSDCVTPRSMQQSCSHSQRSDSNCATPRITQHTQGCGQQFVEEKQQGLAEHAEQLEEFQFLNLQSQNHRLGVANMELQKQMDSKSNLEENTRLLKRIAELEAQVAACNSKLISHGIHADESNVSQGVNCEDEVSYQKQDSVACASGCATLPLQLASSYATEHLGAASSLKPCTFLEQLHAWHDKFIGSADSNPGI